MQHSRNVSGRRGATQVGQVDQNPDNLGEVKDDTLPKGFKKPKLANTEESYDYCSEEEEDEIESC